MRDTHLHVRVPSYHACRKSTVHQVYNTTYVHILVAAVGFVWHIYIDSKLYFVLFSFYSRKFLFLNSIFFCEKEVHLAIISNSFVLKGHNSEVLLF